MYYDTQTTKAWRKERSGSRIFIAALTIMPASKHWLVFRQAERREKLFLAVGTACSKTWSCEKALTYLRISEQDTDDHVGVISVDITEKVSDK